MKKKIIFLIMIIIILSVTIYLAISGYGNKIYNYYINDGVLDYGSELSIYQIIGDDFDVKEYPELANYTYKKAKVKSMGSTTYNFVTIGNNKITFIGNRNLIEINDNLYVYFE